MQECFCSAWTGGKHRKKRRHVKAGNLLTSEAFILVPVSHLTVLDGAKTLCSGGVDFSSPCLWL